MVRETNGPVILCTQGYTDGEKLIGIPPKDRNEKDEVKEIMTEELYKETGMLLCKAEKYTEEITANVAATRKYGITEMPTGATWNKTIKPEKIGKNGTDMIID